MADLTFTAANILASAQVTRRQEYAAGAALSRGDLVYLDSSNQWVKTIVNASAPGNGISDLRGIVESDGAAGQRISVIVKDPALTTGATMVKGTIYVASGTAGKIAPIADLVTGWYRVPVMAAISTTVANFDPNALATGATD